MKLRRRLPRTGASAPAAAVVATTRRQYALPNYQFPQDQARVRRRQRLRVQYDGAEFDLLAEVDAICRPLAVEVSGVLSGPVVLRDRSIDGRPLVFRFEVEAVVDAVHALRAKVIELLAGGKQISAETRARLARAVGAGVPEVSDAQLMSGAWVDGLVAHVGPLAGDLASLLGRSAAPAGCVSAASEALIEALRPLDRAALDLGRRIPKVREYQELLASRPAIVAERKARWERERRERELARLKLASVPRPRRPVKTIVVEGIR